MSTSEDLTLATIAGAAFGGLVMIVAILLWGSCAPDERDPHEDGFVEASR